MIAKKRRILLVAAVASAVAVSACGSAPEPGVRTGTAVRSATVTASATASATLAAAIATDRPAAMGATATPAPAGETGIAGIATIGPTCPVERADSPCPDRPYETRITIWRGTTIVAETRSGADGRFFVLVPPGEYRVVGESGSTLPRGTETTATVDAGQVAEVELRFDSGIR